MSLALVTSLPGGTEGCVDGVDCCRYCFVSIVMVQWVPWKSVHAVSDWLLSRSKGNMRRCGRHIVHPTCQKGCSNYFNSIARPWEMWQQFKSILFKLILQNDSLVPIVKLPSGECNRTTPMRSKHSFRFQVKAWCRQATSHYPNQCWPKIYVVQATSHYLNQWWLVYWRTYASLGLKELRRG